MDKKLCLIVKTGPSFDPDEISKAHKALDEAGVPRDFDGNILTLSERIHWMHGMLNAFTLFREMGGCKL